MKLRDFRGRERPRQPKPLFKPVVSLPEKPDEELRNAVALLTRRLEKMEAGTRYEPSIIDALGGGKAKKILHMGGGAPTLLDFREETR